MEKLMNLEETAVFLNVKKSRLYYLVFKQEIPHIKLGTSLRFSPKKLQDWLKSKHVSVQDNSQTQD